VAATEGSIQAQLDSLTANSAAITEQAITLTMTYGPKLVLAILTLIIGLWIINRIVALAKRTMEARKVEPTLARFLTSLSSVGLKLLLLISVAGMVGIQTTSFIAVLGAAGLAIGLALQGSLANFAGGVLILLFKPFRVGHVIDTGGALGTVDEIGILNTILKTFDNKTIIIPNGNLANNQIVNMSLEENRRVDWVFGVGYDDDLKKVKEVLQGLLDAEERILKDPATTIALNEFGESSINFVVRAWTKAGDLWPVYWDMNEKVKAAFDEHGISIPFPQRDVHLHNTAV
jgi:small conductance mechanosensitive channel